MIETDPKLVRIHHLDLLEYFSDSEERLISQLDWLLDRTGNVREGRYWVYYSTSRWARELHLSPSTVQRTIAHLIRIGVLISRNYNHHAYDRTRWLTINYDRLGEMGIRAQHFCENDRARKAHILVEQWEEEQEKQNAAPRHYGKDSFFYQLPKEVQAMMLAH